MAVPDSFALNVTTDWNFLLQRNVAGANPTISNNQYRKLIKFIKGAAIALSCDELYVGARSIVGGGNEELDLAGTGLANPVGDQNITFARVKFFFAWLLNATDILADATTGNAATHIIIGAAAVNPAALFLGGTTPTLRVNNGGQLMWVDPGAAGVLVTAGTGDKLKITNGDGVVTAKYLLAIGGSAT